MLGTLFKIRLMYYYNEDYFEDTWFGLVGGMFFCYDVMAIVFY